MSPTEQDPESPDASKPEPPADSGVATAPSISVDYQPGVERFVLVGLSGPALGLEYTLAEGSVIIGRTRKSQLRLQDSEVSRQHLRLTLLTAARGVGRGAVLAEDLDSRNGIQVNGQSTTRAVLEGGEKILVGRSVLRLDRRDEIDVAHDAHRRAEALRDPLTRLGNRQALREAFERAERVREADCGRYAVLLIDLDHFKQVNDRFGHAAGDAALRHAAQTITEVMRSGDTAFRMGGEEFIVLVPGADVAEARTVAERLRAAIAAAPATHDGVSIPLTASLGIAPGGPQAIEQADRALYAAKNGGRNRVCEAE